MNPATLKNLLLLIFILCLSACGVKGDPLPPEKAPRLGRGHPTYSKASEYISPDYTSPDIDNIDSEESNEREE